MFGRIEWSMECVVSNNKFEILNLRTELMYLGMKVLLDFATTKNEINYFCFSFLLFMHKISEYQLGALMI